MKKEIIEKVYLERYDNGVNSRSLAKALNLLIESTYAKPERILYELLQNADDSALGANVDYSIYLLKGYLVISYNGKPFDEGDLRSLCSVGASSKVNTDNKIGYKGIGFKSVFSISNCVWILSEENCFRFDKHYKEQESQGYPWQIIPIWTDIENLPNNGLMKQIINPENITIILQLNDFQVIKNSLNTMIYGNHEIILFLRKVKKITCYKEISDELVETLELSREDDEQQQIRKVKVDKKAQGILGYQYLVHEFTVEVPKKIQEALQNLPKKDCPEKLRNTSQTQITLAVSMDPFNLILPSKGNSSIYCYLPTTIKKNIPYHINAEFLTNDTRTHFYKSNEWNDWLFEQVGYQQFEWAKQTVLNTQFKTQISSLIRLEYSLNKSSWDYSIKVGFNKGVEQAKNEVAFLPEYNSDVLGLLQESIVDKTSYSFSSLDATILVKMEAVESFEVENPKIVDPNIKDLDKLISLGAKEFNIVSLREMLNRQEYQKFKEPKENEKLIRFFANAIKNLTSVSDKNAWNEALSDTNFLLTEGNLLRPPTSVYFTPIDIDITAFSDLFTPEVLATEVYTKLLNAPTIIQWLSDLQVKQSNAIELLKREVVEKVLNKDQLSIQNVIPLTQFIFQYYSQLEDDVKNKIKKSLKALTKNNQLIPIARTYLADVYKPSLPVEKLNTSIEIVSESYVIDSENKSQYGKWNYFFSEVGIQKQMSLKVFQDNQLQSIEDYVVYAEDYISYLQDKFEDTIKEVHNLFYITFTEELGNVDFARMFWNRLIDSTISERLIGKEGQVRAIVGSSRRKEPVDSLFLFYVKRYDSFPTVDNVCLPTIEVYSSNLKKWWGEFKPISALEIPVEIENYLGIRNTLYLSDHLVLLQNFSESESTINVAPIHRIYTEMLLNLNIYTEIELESIQTWGKTRKLLADNNTFQSVRALYFFDIPEFSAPQKSSLFFNVIGTHLEQKKLCKLFGVKILEKEDLLAEKEGQKLEETFKDELLRLAVVLAYDFVSHNGGELEKKKELLIKKIKETTFYQCSYIHLTYRNRNNELIYETPIVSWLEADTFYYQGDWNSMEFMYDCLPQLCTYFKLKGSEQIMQLLLLFPHNNLKKWLTAKGVSKDILNQIFEKKYLGIPTEDLISIEEPLEPYEVIKPDKITGYNGEKYVFNYLREKYPNATIQWLNEDKESEKPYDIILQDDGRFVYIDVKTTVLSNPFVKAFMSQKEYDFMHKNKAVYEIYRVSDINGLPRITVFSLADLEKLMFKNGFTIQIVSR